MFAFSWWFRDTDHGEVREIVLMQLSLSLLKIPLFRPKSGHLTQQFGPLTGRTVMSGCGPLRRFSNVRSSVANGGKADVLATFAKRRE